MFKLMETCSKPYFIRLVNSRKMLECHHQRELEQKKTDNIKAPKVDKNNLAKTMENIVPHLNLVREVRGVRGVPLAYVVRHHVKVAHISPRYDAYLNLDEEMSARAPIVDAKLSFKTIQECLDRAYLSYQCDTFNIDNALCIFMNMHTVKKRKSMHDG